MHEDLICQLNEAVTEVFAVMLNLVCSFSRPKLSTELTIPSLAASVRFSGSLEGCCCLQMEERTATELAAKLTGLAPVTITRSLSVDAVAELCNMIAGRWKRQYPTDSEISQISCPVVTCGQCPQSGASLSEKVTLQYRFADHDVTLRVAFN